MTNKQFTVAFAFVTLLGTCALLYVAHAQAAVSPTTATATVTGGTPAPVVATQPRAAQAAQALPQTPFVYKPKVPGDLFQETACAVLNGKYPASESVRSAYRRGLEAGVTVKGRVWLTCYWSSEGHDSTWDGHGNRCGPRHIACNRLPYGTDVWVQWPVRDRQGNIVNYLSQMRTVLDTGAHWNDGVADRKGCNLWMDRHTEGPYDSYAAQYAVIPSRRPPAGARPRLLDSRHTD
jgi:hypothetical protein